MRALLTASFLLAFVGGYADAASYLLTGSFTGHLTGNTVLAMIHLAQAAWREAGTNALAIVGFVAGTAAADWLPTNAGAPKTVRQLRAPLALQGLLFLAGAVCLRWGGRIGVDLALTWLCLGMGLQNGALRKCGGIGVHTTFITGMGTSLLATGVRDATGEKKPDAKEKRSAKTLAAVLCLFALGALAGGWLCLRFHEAGLIWIFVPWVSAWLLAAFA